MTDDAPSSTPPAPPERPPDRAALIFAGVQVAVLLGYIAPANAETWRHVLIALAGAAAAAWPWIYRRARAWQKPRTPWTDEQRAAWRAARGLPPDPTP